jgi:hypothetical protein
VEPADKPHTNTTDNGWRFNGPIFIGYGLSQKDEREQREAAGKADLEKSPCL